MKININKKIVTYLEHGIRNGQSLFVVQGERIILFK